MPNVEYFLKSNDGYMDSKTRDRFYTMRFQLFTDAPDEDPATVSSYIPIARYSPYATDLAAICKKISVSLVEVGEFECVYDFDTVPIETQDKEEEDDPTERPWIWTFGSNKSTKILQKDYSATPKAVVNKANCPFDPPIEVPAAFPTISVTAYKDSFTFSDVALYTNSINESSWNGFDAKTLRCVEYGATQIYENNELIYQYTVVLEQNPDGPWNPLKVLNVGVLEKRDGKLVNIEENGIAITSPVPLTNFGQKSNPALDPIYLDFNAYREVDWTNIL